MPEEIKGSEESTAENLTSHMENVLMNELSGSHKKIIAPGSTDKLKNLMRSLVASLVTAGDSPTASQTDSQPTAPDQSFDQISDYGNPEQSDPDAVFQDDLDDSGEEAYGDPGETEEEADEAEDAASEETPQNAADQLGSGFDDSGQDSTSPENKTSPSTSSPSPAFPQEEGGDTPGEEGGDTPGEEGGEENKTADGAKEGENDDPYKKKEHEKQSDDGYKTPQDGGIDRYLQAEMDERRKQGDPEINQPQAQPNDGRLVRGEDKPYEQFGEPEQKRDDGQKKKENQTEEKRAQKQKKQVQKKAEIQIKPLQSATKKQKTAAKPLELNKFRLQTEIAAWSAYMALVSIIVLILIIIGIPLLLFGIGEFLIPGAIRFWVVNMRTLLRKIGKNKALITKIDARLKIISQKIKQYQQKIKKRQQAANQKKKQIDAAVARNRR